MHQVKTFLITFLFSIISCSACEIREINFEDTNELHYAITHIKPINDIDERIASFENDDDKDKFINAKTIDGLTPLHIAAIIKTIKFLHF